MGISRAYAQAAEPGNFFVAGKNKIINGDFAINQRAFSSTTTSDTYGFDRFKIGFSGGTVTYSAQTFTAGAAPVSPYEAQNFARVVTSGQSGTSNYAHLIHPIENVRTLADQPVTVSFWAKASSGTPKIAVELAQAFGSGGSAGVNTYAGQATLSTSWARYSVTATLPSMSGKTIGTGSALFLQLWTSGGSDFNSRTGSLGIQNTTIDLWGVQVEAGSVATPFTTATGTLAGELAACQRYYQTYGGVAFQSFANGQCNSATDASITMAFPVNMRTSPTFSSSGNFSLTRAGGSQQTVTALTSDIMSSTSAVFGAAVAANLVAGDATRIINANDVNARLNFSSEL